VGSSWVLLKPATVFLLVLLTLERNARRTTCTYLSQLIVSLKNTGPTILLALTAHQTPNFTGWGRASWVRCGFCELQKRLFCVFMYPCKWNHASSEKNVKCGAISPSTTDCWNQLQKWTLKMNPASRIARLQGVDYCCFIGSVCLSASLSCCSHFGA
jgi:hypothetical protein